MSDFTDRNLNSIQFEHTESNTEHSLHAYSGGEHAGELHWRKQSGQKWGRQMQQGEVDELRVEPAYRRQGVGTALWNEGKSYSPAPVHSRVQTLAGSRWADKVGD